MVLRDASSSGVWTPVRKTAHPTRAGRGLGEPLRACPASFTHRTRSHTMLFAPWQAKPVPLSGIGSCLCACFSRWAKAPELGLWSRGWGRWPAPPAWGPRLAEPGRQAWQSWCKHSKLCNFLTDFVWIFSSRCFCLCCSPRGPFWLHRRAGRQWLSRWRAICLTINADGHVENR